MITNQEQRGTCKGRCRRPRRRPRRRHHHHNHHKPPPEETSKSPLVFLSYNRGTAVIHTDTIMFFLCTWTEQRNFDGDIQSRCLSSCLGVLGVSKNGNNEMQSTDKRTNKQAMNLVACWLSTLTTLTWALMCLSRWTRVMSRGMPGVA